MNLFGVMEVSGSALKAERIRADVVAANMANAETTRTSDGGPYRRQHVVFTAAPAAQSSFGSYLLGGTAPVAAPVDKGSVLKRYDPEHPDADENGFVSYPDINPLTEMVDMMGATRAYGLNSSAVQAEKGMIATSLDILK
jgi:flagellar basal-body rod protein FlgC